MTKTTINRRDFLKIALAGAGTLAAGLVGAKVFGLRFAPAPTSTPTWTPAPSDTLVPTATDTPTPTATPRVTGTDIERLIPAAKLPVVEYHYMGYSAGGVVESEELINAQINFFKLNGYNTVTDVDLAKFLAGEKNLPAKTFALRVDQGPARFDEFEDLLAVFQKNGFSAMVYLISGENYSDEQWQKLANWHKDGLISIGSHSITHADFALIDSSTAYNEAYYSKKFIENRLADLGINIELVSFAFPSDSVPDNVDFLKSAGYKFGLGGNLFGVEYNAATIGQFLIPSLYPYVSQNYMDSISANRNNNPLSIPLVSGMTFAEMIYVNTTPITVSAIESALGESYPEVQFANFQELPVSEEQQASLVRPVGIILHTDAQDGNSSDLWKTSATYNGLLERQTDVHFAVDQNGPAQFLKMYPDFCTPSRGAIGFMDHISIEMCGRDYKDVLDPQANPAKVAVIKDTTQNTITLIKRLIEQYEIDPVNVLGHYQATASGKADPGKEYMEQYFLPRLQEALAV